MPVRWCATARSRQGWRWRRPTMLRWQGQGPGQRPGWRHLPAAATRRLDRRVGHAPWPVAKASPRPLARVRPRAGMGGGSSPGGRGEDPPPRRSWLGDHETARPEGGRWTDVGANVDPRASCICRTSSGSVAIQATDDVPPIAPVGGPCRDLPAGHADDRSTPCRRSNRCSPRSAVARAAEHPWTASAASSNVASCCVARTRPMTRAHRTARPNVVPASAGRAGAAPADPVG